MVGFQTAQTYHTFIYVLVFTVGVLVVLWGISIYFVKTGKMTTDSWMANSLGVPDGSVRALLALLILFSVIFAVLTESSLPALPDWMIGILGAVIGFYFGATSGTRLSG